MVLAILAGVKSIFYCIGCSIYIYIRCRTQPGWAFHGAPPSESEGDSRAFERLRSTWLSARTRWLGRSGHQEVQYQTLEKKSGAFVGHNLIIQLNVQVLLHVMSFADWLWCAARTLHHLERPPNILIDICGGLGIRHAYPRGLKGLAQVRFAKAVEASGYDDIEREQVDNFEDG